MTFEEAKASVADRVVDRPSHFFTVPKDEELMAVMNQLQQVMDAMVQMGKTIELIAKGIELLNDARH